MFPAVVTPVDPGTAIETALNGITSAINGNLGSILLVAGSLIAVGVVWKLMRKFV